MDERNPDITQMLRRWSEGHREVLDELIGIVYAELRTLARAYLSRERPDHTLQPTALVHEAFVRLVDQRVSWRNRAHFFGIAAQCMRRILVDYARRRRALKRGAAESGSEVDVEMVMATWGSPDQLIALDLAVEKLAQQNPRCASVAELHYFGGLTVEQAAVVMNVSPATIKRELRTARSFLRGQLEQD